MAANLKIKKMKDVLTFNEASEFTGLSKSYLYKLTSGQKVPHYKPFGKMVYFNRLELESWLQQNKVLTTDEINSKAQSYCMSNKKGGQK
jgi:excisionase family DNA binding protein